MKSRRKKIAAPARGVAIGALLVAAVATAAPANRATLGSDRLQSLGADSEITLEGVDRSRAALSGPTQVVARLSLPAAARANGASKGAILAEQAAFIGRIQQRAPDATVLGSTQLVLNAVFLEVDARHLAAIEQDVAVSRVAQVGDYRLDLTETVPYIGAASVHGAGANGAGVVVAVLDSGVDYTHAAFGGPGTVAAYQAAYGTSTADPRNTTTDGLFPTAKVVGGFDFVGETWTGSGAPGSPGQTLSPDPDPIPNGDLVSNGGHGTHVADIIGGAQGAAPGAGIIAVKVCSATATSCSGVALIQGMEFAVDPNGDGDTSDHVDIINMSLGSNFGQPFDDDLSAAVDNATAAGVLTVASAGNGSDKTFITGSPAAALTALSVAQTAVPSSRAQLMRILAPAVTPQDRGAVFQTWSTPLASVMEGAVQYGNGAGGNLNGCVPFPAGSVIGRIVLVDRGVCAFSAKIQNIQAGGGALGIIGIIDASAPFAGAFGGGAFPTIPGFMINLADANAIRGGATVRFDPANQLALVGSVVATSSRGPMFEDGRIKPEIGAPGASVSAQSGTGTGTGAFGGTSGAAPMVSGSAALLLQIHPNAGPATLKQMLIDTAEPQIFSATSPSGILPDQLAPISRIGGGEVRVDRAAIAGLVVYPDDADSGDTGGVSLGFVDADRALTTISRDIWLENRSGHGRLVNITALSRYADDAATGAISVSVTPSTLFLSGNDVKVVRARFRIDGTKLRNNLMSAGVGTGPGALTGGGDDPRALTANEHDGYLRFTTGSEVVHLPWHVLPRKSANTVNLDGHPLEFDAEGLGQIRLRNKGVGTSQIDSYSLLAVSPNQPEGARGEQDPRPDIRGFGVTTFSVPTTVCSSGFLWAFAINTWERLTLPRVVEHDVLIDLNRDGNPEFIVFNADQGAFLNPPVVDGRHRTWTFNTTTGTLSSRFQAEHAINSTNTVLFECIDRLGMTAADAGTRQVNVSLNTFDNYFNGNLSDSTAPVTITPFGEEFVALTSDIPAMSNANLPVINFGTIPGNTPELGLMLVTNGDRGAASRGGATEATEALFIARPGGTINFGP